MAWSRASFVAGSCLVLAGFSAAKVQAADGPIVALFDIQDKSAKLSATTLDSLIDLLAARLAQGGYQIVPRAQIKERLRSAQAESYKACYEDSCQIELGRELAAQKTLATQILPIGDNCQLTSSLFDLKRATAELAATAEARCSDEGSFLPAIQSLAEQLVKPLRESRQETQNRLGALEAVLADTQAPKAERLKKAWELARRIGEDSMVPEATRSDVLAKFLEAFPSDNPYQSDAQKLRRAFQPGTLLVRSEPNGALVSIDGKPIGSAPVGRDLKEGEHLTEASLEGFLSARQKVKITPGERTEITLKLSEPPTHPLRTWGRVAFWGGLGFGLLSGGAVALSQDAWGQYVDTHDPDKKSSSDLWQTLAIAGGATGAALMLTGVVLWAIEPDQNERARRWQAAHPVALLPSGDGSGWVLVFRRNW